MALFAKEKGVSMIGSEYAEILKDIIQYSNWSSEYFIIDCPAGSSDEFKRVISVFDENFLGSIIVVQPAHPIDAKRQLDIHKINDIPIIGIIENMIYFECPKCNEKYEIFGKSVGEELAKEFNVDYLGGIPLSMKIREGILNANPYLGEYNSPIIKAVDKILELQPRRPGFLEAIKRTVKEKVGEIIVKSIVEIFYLINKQIPIGDLQVKYGFSGGRNIRLNLLDDLMENVIATVNMRMENGKLIVVKNPKIVDVQIDLKYRAFAWSLLGKKPVYNGEIPYDLITAWFNGDARVYGSGDTIKAMNFLSETWNEVQAYLTPEIKKSLEMIV
jgi:hypothetical protein